MGQHVPIFLKSQLILTISFQLYWHDYFCTQILGRYQTDWFNVMASRELSLWWILKGLIQICHRLKRQFHHLQRLTRRWVDSSSEPEMICWDGCQKMTFWVVVVGLGFVVKTRCIAISFDCHNNKLKRVFPWQKHKTWISESGLERIWVRDPKGLVACIREKPGQSRSSTPSTWVLIEIWMVYLLHEDFPKIVNHLHVGCIPEMTRVVKAIEKSEYQLANLRIGPIGGQPVYATTSNSEKERDSLFWDEQSIPTLLRCWP